MNARTFRVSTPVKWGPNSNGQSSNYVVSLSTIGEPLNAGTDSNYYWEEGALTMRPTLVLAIESDPSSSPPICDDEATTGGKKPKQYKFVELGAPPSLAARTEQFVRLLQSWP